MASLRNGAIKDDVLKFISDSATYGNLGLFIGTGFSKAVLQIGGNDALSWKELLERACQTLKVDWGAIDQNGIDYPKIATKICEIYAEMNQVSYEESLSKLKSEIANLTGWYSEHSARILFAEYFDALSPAWIVTTNYDLIIESILVGKSMPLGPNDQLSNPKGIIPIYHLHGIRTNPNEIIISQEDYIALFRPTEYRQIKLALTLKESTVLFLGYGLGDVNVLTALDWSKNVFSGETNNFPHDAIQVIRKKKPAPVPYRDKNGVLIIETDALHTFFQEYQGIRSIELKKDAERNQSLEKLIKILNDPDQKTIDMFIDDRGFRRDLMESLSKFSINLISGFISFLNKCIDQTWVRAEPDGAFEAYNQNLNIILDILIGFDIANFPPALFQTAAYGLQRVAPYIGPAKGQSHAAAKTWEARKGELSKDTLQELKNIADQHYYFSLRQLLDR